MGSWSLKTADSIMRTGCTMEYYATTGVIFVSGGWDSGTTPTTSHKQYNPTTDTWTAKASMPGARVDSMSAIVGTVLYVAKGADAALAQTNTMYAYNISNNTWSSKATAGSNNDGRYMVGGVNGSSIYMAGGDLHATSPSNIVHAYNTSTDTWSAKAVLTAARTVAAGCEDASGMIHVFGGQDAAFNSQSSHYQYNPSTNTWASKAALSTARAYNTAALVGSTPYTLMGWDQTFTALGTLSAYNPSTNTWTTKTPANSVPRYQAIASFAGGADIAVIGGENNSGVDQSRFEYYSTDQAPNAPTLNTPANNASLDAGAATTLTWTKSDPDAGDAQAGFALRRHEYPSGILEFWNVATQQWQTSPTSPYGLVINPSAAGTVTLPAGAWDTGKSYAWTISTTDAAGLQGPYATERVFTVGTAPSVTVLGPGGPVTSQTTQRVYWDYSQAQGSAQVGYQVKVFTQAQATIGGFNPTSSPSTYDSGTVASAVVSALLPNNLTNNATYWVYVRAQMTGPVWSAWSGMQFTTAFSTTLGSAILLAQAIENVYNQLTTQVGRAVTGVDTPTAVQASPQPIVMIGLGEADYTPVATDTSVLSGEITTGSLIASAASVVSHTTGAASYTLSTTWQSDATHLIYTVGVFNNMDFDHAPGQANYVPGSPYKRCLVFAYRLSNAPISLGPGDQFTTTETVTF